MVAIMGTAFHAEPWRRGSDKDGVEARKETAWRGTVHRSAGTISVRLSGQENRSFVVWGAEFRWGPTYRVLVGLKSAVVARFQQIYGTAAWSGKQWHFLGQVDLRRRTE